MSAGPACPVEVVDRTLDVLLADQLGQVEIAGGPGQFRVDKNLLLTYTPGDTVRTRLGLRIQIKYGPNIRTN